VRLKDIRAGARAIHRVRLPLVNVPTPFGPSQPELAAQRERDQAAAAQSGAAASVVPDSVEVGVRVLTGLEMGAILENTARTAVEKGGKNVPTDPIYQYWLSVYTVVLSCVDPDSDPSNPDPFFGDRGNLDSAVAEILGSPHIGRDGIIFLHEQQEHWQDICNPQASKVSPEKLYELAGEVAASKDADPFLRLRPAMQWLLVRFLASQLLTAPDHRLPFGPSSQESSSDSLPESASSPPVSES
jgi:hypothetical protein